MKTKTTLLALLILVIGFVIGVLSTGSFTMHKINKARDLRTESGFMEHVYKSFDLTKTSEDSVRFIMQDFAKKNHERHKALNRQMHQSRLQLEKDLSGFLTEEQMSKLRRMMRHQGRKPPHHPPPHHPPPPRR